MEPLNATHVLLTKSSTDVGQTFFVHRAVLHLAM